MEEIKREIDEMKMDVLVLTERKRKGTRSEILGNYIHLSSGAKKYERAKRGVSVLINKKWNVSIKNWVSIGEGILKLDMNIWCYKLTIFGIYAPNEGNGTTIKDEFFVNLNEEILKSGNGRQLILMEDMNGRTGRKLETQYLGILEKT